jgi:hypothetical protein
MTADRREEQPKKMENKISIIIFPMSQALDKNARNSAKS